MECELLLPPATSYNTHFVPARPHTDGYYYLFGSVNSQHRVPFTISKRVYKEKQWRQTAKITGKYYCTGTVLDDPSVNETPNARARPVARHFPPSGKPYNAAIPSKTKYYSRCTIILLHY